MTQRKAPYRTKRTASQAEVDFELQLRMAGITGFVQEYVFHPLRKWRFDFADPDRKIAFEIEGGVWSRGRHVSPQGFIQDARKYNEAALLGWQVYRFPTDWIDTGEALRYAEMAVRGRSDWAPMEY